MPAAALFLVRFEQYAEISAMLRAGEDQALLALVAQRLSLVARALGGIVGRCGLDTFTVCVPDVDEQGAAQVSTKLLEDLGASYELGGRPLIAVFRVGAALYPEHGRTVEELQRCVQVSMVPLKEREGPAGTCSISACWRGSRTGRPGERSAAGAHHAEHGAVRAVLPARLRQRLRPGRGMRGAAALASSRAGQRLAGRDHRAGRA